MAASELSSSNRASAPEPGQALSPDLLYRRCDPAELPFELTSELDGASGLIGQDRAIEAVEFAMALRRKGYNVYALGPSGTGKHTLVDGLLRRRAAGEPTPPDWCYVNNFADPQKPRRLQLPAGRAAGLREAMKRLVRELRAALPAAFERDDYRARHDVIDQQFKERSEQAFGELQRRAEQQGIALLRTPMGLALAPRRDGKVLTPEMFEALPEAERERIQKEIEGVQSRARSGHAAGAAMGARAPRGGARAQSRDDGRCDRADDGRAARRLPRSARCPRIPRRGRARHQGECRRFPAASPAGAAGRNAARHAGPGAVPASHGRGAVPPLPDQRHRRQWRAKGAPVVYEDNPTHQTLVGRVEHLARFGALVTDFNLLTAGALHRANGGYLILDAQRLLTGSLGWPSLKRALNAGEIRIESLEQLLSMASTVSLDPEPIPLQVKIVLLGPPQLYYLLSSLDDDFPELFKIAAEFDDRVERSPDVTARFAKFIAGAAQREHLLAFDRGAVARVVEQASRLVGDSARLTTGLREIVDLLQEADQIAKSGGRSFVSAAEVQAAIDAKFRRGDRIYRRLQEEIGRHIIRIETDGAEIGQINGLSVLSLGGLAFGNPTRITARVRLGRGEVVDIEREVALGGPLHSKGVLILSGFLGGRYGQTRPLSLNASLVFEQSYGGVDGDSASAAELFALLSALAEAPIRQSFAVTGSVDQLGRIQAIGGVNEKIEGFFDVCRRAGLTGRQGVIIPASNVEHLMLRRDVVEAAAAEQFRVLPIATIDQGIALLTGMPAGEPDAEGSYPPDTINHRVSARLDGFAAKAAELMRSAALGSARP